jgi:hypothetical protein
MKRRFSTITTIVFFGIVALGVFGFILPELIELAGPMGIMP